MNIPKIEELFKAGAHFGHRTNRWHPKMKPFIFCSKKGVYVLDLNKTQECMETAFAYMQKLVKEEKSILFVGTKNQVKKPMKEAAIACGMPYIVGKWSGGYLTNFTVIKKSIRKYTDLLVQKEEGKLDRYNKKERLNIDRDLKKMEAKLGGLVTLNKLPDALFVWDIKEEATAIEEALSMKVPVIAIVDTNVNPDLVKYPIPANDDSTKTVKVILDAVVDAVVEARKAKKD
ncbi:MAG: 30S ribosomal protein S2 [Candidatus Falkowbacteria bacterium]